MYTIHLFAGAGGGILADILLGHTPIAACEIEDYPRRVLLQRQLDGVIPVFPIWDDIKTLRSDNPECAEYFALWCRYRAQLIVCGGFPCQDISRAGKGQGITGPKSGLWGEMARVIREIRPCGVFVENAAMLVSRGLHRVLGDLANMGYDARWGVLSYAATGGCHVRERIWIFAYPHEDVQPTQRPYDGDHPPSKRVWGSRVQSVRLGTREQLDGWLRQATVLDDGLAGGLGELAAIGNGQVPIVAAKAFELLKL